MSLLKNRAFTVGLSCIFVLPMSALAQWTVGTGAGDYTVTQDSGRVPFRIDPGADTNAMFMDSDGDTALGTTAPLNDFNSRLHIADLTPDIAFEDENDNQIWSFYANNNSIGFCDETSYPQPGGPTVPCSPFFIQTGAPVASLGIAANGYVGMGTQSTPTAKLHVSGGTDAKLLVDNTDAAAVGDQFLFELRNANSRKIRFAISAEGGGNIWTFDNDPAADAFNISKIGTGLNEFKVKSNGDGTFRGRSFATNHVNTSTRTAKTDFMDVDVQEVLNSLAAMPVSQWRYRVESESTKHIGPVAEDFQTAFGIGDGKTISTVDASGVALASIKALYEQIVEKDKKLDEQRVALEKQQQMLDVQHQRLLRLEETLEGLLTIESADQRIASLD